ncbi:hypothetical protein [Actinoallomurus sp. CA-142502]|uniref:hypothetical protein n=1 Tax=Actinoallomurus sp. CA-142502 TaxID=3239885 RepID=UPI003D8E0294
MATSKDDKATSPKARPPARKADEDAKTEATFAGEGLALAGDVRAFAEDLRGQLADLSDRTAKTLHEGDPQDGDEQVSAGIHRITTAVRTLADQVDALVAAAAQLERDAVR